MADEQNNAMSLDEIKAAFKLNIGSLDNMLDVVTGKYHTPTLPGEPDKITRHIKEGTGWDSRTSYREYAEASGEEKSAGSNRLERPRPQQQPVYREAAISQQVPVRYAQFIKELDRIQFSDDEEKRTKQMETVISAIRSSLQDLVIQDVAKNTRKAFGEYVKDIFKVGGGIKVDFNFNGTEVSISARGPFTGDETICVSKKEDGRVVASVKKDDESGTIDLTSNFGITIGE